SIHSLPSRVPSCPYTTLFRSEGLGRNFVEDDDMMTGDRGWNRYRSDALLTTERPGLPVNDGPFERGWPAMRSFQFSDPSIVTAHFDPEAPLLGRPMLLGVTALGLHYLNGTRGA